MCEVWHYVTASMNAFVCCSASVWDPVTLLAWQMFNKASNFARTRCTAGKKTVNRWQRWIEVVNCHTVPSSPPRPLRIAFHPFLPLLLCPSMFIIIVVACVCVCVPLCRVCLFADCDCNLLPRWLRSREKSPAAKSVLIFLFGTFFATRHALLCANL